MSNKSEWIFTTIPKMLDRTYRNHRMRKYDNFLEKCQLILVMPTGKRYRMGYVLTSAHFDKIYQVYQDVKDINPLKVVELLKTNGLVNMFNGCGPDILYQCEYDKVSVEDCHLEFLHIVWKD